MFLKSLLILAFIFNAVSTNVFASADNHGGGGPKLKIEKRSQSGGPDGQRGKGGQGGNGFKADGANGS